MRVVLPLRQEKNTSKATTQQGLDSTGQQVQTVNQDNRNSSKESCKSVEKSSSSVAAKQQQQQQHTCNTQDQQQELFCSSTSSSGSFSSSVLGSRKRKQADSMVLLRKGGAKKDVAEKKTNRTAWVEENSAASAYEDKPENNTCANAPAGSFAESLKRRGLEVAEQDSDGNCLFRAVSLQVYGDSSNHGEVRRRCLDFMAKDEAHFSSFITDEPFRDYIHRKRRDGVHGNNPEIQAISELFNRPVEVFDAEVSAEKPLNIFHAEYKTADKPIRVSYHDGNHYNAVIDPLCPTAGLGLGLPGLDPGLADRLQMEKAVLLSDIEATDTQLQTSLKTESNNNNYSSINQMYKQKALLLSDIEATEFQIDQAVLASSIEASCNSQKPSSHQHHADATSIMQPPPQQISSSDVAAAFSSSHQQQTEYPDTVQELVFNGFELQKVIHAYELIGDNFDHLLSFLLSSGNSSR